MSSKLTYVWHMTLEVDAANEVSAKKKLKDWLEPSLALKKNHDIDVMKIASVRSEVQEVQEEKSNIPGLEPPVRSLESEPEPSQRNFPKLNKTGQEWDDSWADEDWDSLDEPEPEAEEDDWEEDDWEDEKETNEFGDLLSGLNKAEEGDDEEDDDDDEEDW